MLFTPVHRFVDNLNRFNLQKTLKVREKKAPLPASWGPLPAGLLDRFVKVLLHCRFFRVTRNSFTTYPLLFTNSHPKMGPETKKIFSFIGRTFDHEKILNGVGKFSSNGFASPLLNLFQVKSRKFWPEREKFFPGIILLFQSFFMSQKLF